MDSSNTLTAPGDRAVLTPSAPADRFGVLPRCGLHAYYITREQYEEQHRLICAAEAEGRDVTRLGASSSHCSVGNQGKVKVETHRGLTTTFHGFDREVGEGRDEPLVETHTDRLSYGFGWIASFDEGRDYFEAEGFVGEFSRPGYDFAAVSVPAIYQEMYGDQVTEYGPDFNQFGQLTSAKVREMASNKALGLANSGRGAR